MYPLTPVCLYPLTHVSPDTCIPRPYAQSMISRCRTVVVVVQCLNPYGLRALEPEPPMSNRQMAVPCNTGAADRANGAEVGARLRGLAPPSHKSRSGPPRCGLMLPCTVTTQSLHSHRTVTAQSLYSLCNSHCTVCAQSRYSLCSHLLSEHEHCTVLSLYIYVQ